MVIKIAPSIDSSRSFVAKATPMNRTHEKSIPAEPNQAGVLLLKEFQSRSVRNPRYSLRAYAKSLGVSHTLLSLVINGKRKPSLKVMGLLVNTNTATDTEFSEVKENEFNLIATWVHYSILSLLSFPGFKPNSATIAKTLNVSQLISDAAWRDLVKGGFIKKEATKWIRTKKQITFNNKSTSEATRNFIRGYLAKAEQSMENDPFEVRNLTTITFEMNENDVAYATEKIKAFRRKLSKELELRSGVNRVYSLSIQLFPLSNKIIRGDKQ